nr:hypothetical protein [Pseudomonas sp. LPH1]
MRRKTLLASLLCWLAIAHSLTAAAWQMNEVQECPTSTQNQYWLDCSSPDIPARLPYKLDNGKVEVLPSRATVFCKDGICEYQAQRASGIYYSTGEYAGQIQQLEKTHIVLLRGYYLGNAKDGRIVAYMKGTGPEAGGKQAKAIKVGNSKSSRLNPEQCLDAWITAHQEESGELSVIAGDQLSEWEDWCSKGKTP